MNFRRFLRSFMGLQQSGLDENYSSLWMHVHRVCSQVTLRSAREYCFCKFRSSFTNGRPSTSMETRPNVRNFSNGARFRTYFTNFTSDSVPLKSSAFIRWRFRSTPAADSYTASSFGYKRVTAACFNHGRH